MQRAAPGARNHERWDAPGGGILSAGYRQPGKTAQERGAQILGEIIGYGAASDPHHLTQPDPAGDPAFAAMFAACESGGIRPTQVDYINAHGTGTPLNDAAEALAIGKLLGGES